jgi:energy-converting hydrogenase A subunit M
MHIARAILLLLSADLLSLIKQHIHNIMTATTLTDMQQRISELFNIDNVALIDIIIQELEGYGIDTEEKLDDAYMGCYRDKATFCEDFLSDVFADEIASMPIFLQTAIDWELVWHQTMQKDYFAIYHDSEYYFFNRNF